MNEERQGIVEELTALRKYLLSRDGIPTAGDCRRADALTAAIAAQATIAQYDTKRQIWDSKEQEYRKAIAELQAANVQQGAVIAAMREALESSAYLLSQHPTEFTMQKICSECDQWQGKHDPECQVGVALSNTTQLAADHDAAVRAEERRKVLEEAATVALGHQISETSLCAEWGRQCAAAIRRLHRPIEQLAAQPEESING